MDDVSWQWRLRYYGGVSKGRQTSKSIKKGRQIGGGWGTDKVRLPHEGCSGTNSEWWEEKEAQDHGLVHEVNLFWC